MGSAFPIKIAAKTILAGTALLLLGACASVPVTSEGDKQVGSAQILSICEKLAKSNDTRIAIGLCEKAHMEDPDNPVPLLILGDMLQQQGALAQAGRAYGMAIDLDPENVEAYYGLGKVFLARNQYELATEQFEIARELNASDHRLYNALGVVLDNLGDHVAAQQHYRVGLELAPHNRALKKNLTLSRRLDDSVTSPAIGPRFEVVPAPASTPGETQNGNGGPAFTPGTTPSNRQGPGAPAGRLGHEPLAYAPTVPPQKTPYQSNSKAVVTQASSRQSAITDRHDPMATRQDDADRIEPLGRPAAIETNRNKRVAIRAERGSYRNADAAVLVEQSTATMTIPANDADHSVSEATVENTYLAYFPIVAPSHTQTADSVQAALPQQIAETQVMKYQLAASPIAPQAEQNYIQPLLNSIHTTAAVMPAVAPRTAPGPVILVASGLQDHVIHAEPLVSAPAAQPVQIATLPSDNVELETIQRDKRAPASLVTVPLVPTSVEEGFTPETSVSSLLADFEPGEPLAPRVTLTLEANRFGVGDVTVATQVAALPSADVELRRVPRTRFGREHEGDHETRHIEGEFWDLVDVVNPMQHIPVVASIYRDVTEDEIKPAAKIAGGTLFGGVLGFASSIFDSVVEEVSGQDMTQTAVTALSQESPEHQRSATLVRDQQ